MDILANGIKARSTTGGGGNWVHTISGHVDHVYLTDTYPLYFAMGAKNKKSGENLAIVSIDLDMLDLGNLYPDEDFISQFIMSVKGSSRVALPKIVSDAISEGGDTLTEMNEYVIENIGKFRRMWMDSLVRLGTLSHRGDIDASAIISVAVLNMQNDDVKNMVYHLCDPTITIINKLVCGRAYQQKLEWIMKLNPPSMEEFANVLYYGAASMAAKNKEWVDALKNFHSSVCRAIENGVTIHQRPHAVKKKGGDEKK